MLQLPKKILTATSSQRLRLHGGRFGEVRLRVILEFLFTRMWRSAQCWMLICTCVKFSLMNWWRPFERHAVPRRCSGWKEVESIQSFFTRLLLITTTRTQSKFSRNYILYRIFRTVRIWVWNSNRLCNTTLHDWLAPVFPALRLSNM